MGCMKDGNDAELDQDVESQHAQSCLDDYNVDITKGHAAEYHGPTASEATMQEHAVTGLEQSTDRNRTEIGRSTQFATFDQMAMSREVFLAHHAVEMAAKAANLPANPSRAQCRFSRSFGLATSVDVNQVVATWDANNKLSVGATTTASADTVIGVYDWDVSSQRWNEVTFYAKA